MTSFMHTSDVITEKSKVKSYMKRMNIF